MQLLNVYACYQWLRKAAFLGGWLCPNCTATKLYNPLVACYLKCMIPTKLYLRLRSLPSTTAT